MPSLPVPDDLAADGVVLRRLRPRVVRRIQALTPPQPSPATTAMLEVLTSRRVA